MTRRSIVLRIVPLAVAGVVIGCGKGGNQAQTQADTGSSLLPPMVQQMIGNVMANSINPTYMSIWTKVHRDELSGVPDLAHELHDAAMSIRTGLNRSSTPLPATLLDGYVQLAAMSDSIAQSSQAGDLSAALRQVKSLRLGTCNSCHLIYRR